MISVTSSKSRPYHLEELRLLFEKEWKKDYSFEGAEYGLPLPSPILLVDDEKLIGGLAFTRYPVPGRGGIGLWINALLIITEYRRMGLRSRLVHAAEIEACNNQEKVLYVFSNIPELYQKLGWKCLESSGDFVVLKKQIISNDS